MATGSEKIRVVIAEDHALLRIGLKILLEQRNVVVVGEAENGEQAVTETAKHHPDVVLLDLSMPMMDGIEAATRIREFDREVKIIMLTSNDNEEHIYASLAAGANGYCLKETKPDRLMNALETVRDGDLWLDSNIASKVLRTLPTKKQSNVTTGEQQNESGQLSKDELEVLHLIVEGLDPSEIAFKTGRTEQQIKALEYTIMEKLASSERTQTALQALRQGADGLPVKTAKSCINCGREYNEGFLCCPFDGTPLECVYTDELTGKVFADRYEILARLGSGGMSVVYKARHKLLGRLVAIKLLDPLLCSDLTNARRFREEALASSLLSHPNLINIFDFGLSPNGEPYLVMDYLSGKSLAEMIAKTGRMMVDEAIPMFIQACDGLSHAHSKGVIHRDLKPSNIMVVNSDVPSMSVKVIDFGIAKVLTSARARGQNLTQAGEILGSPTYMSPEQCTGQPLDARSDIYSLGCAMYEAFTGDLPFLGAVALETMQMHLDRDPLPMSYHIPAIPKALDAIVLKAMRKNPNMRHQSMEELKNELVQFVATKGAMSATLQKL